MNTNIMRQNGKQIYRLSRSSKRISLFIILYSSGIAGGYAQSSIFNKFFHVEKHDTVQSVSHAPTVVVLGDSHVQGGYFTKAFRDRLSSVYPIAGFGWVSPHRISGRSEPDDYKILPSHKGWSGSLITRTASMGATGPGGMLVSPPTGDIALTVKSPTCSFDQILIYRTYDVSPLKAMHNVKSFRSGRSLSISPFVVDTLTFRSKQNSILLENSDPNFNVLSGQSGYAGFDLVNTTAPFPYIKFHSIGLDGASYDTYSKISYTKSLSLLSPDILFICLGSNESHGARFNKAAFKDSADMLIRMIREQMPDVKIILCGPPPAFITSKVSVKVKKKARRRYNYVKMLNPHPLLATQALQEVARRYRDCEVVDLYTAMGGVEGAQSLLSRGDIRRDGVHYSVTGYKRMGNALYDEVTAKSSFMRWLKAIELKGSAPQQSVVKSPQ